MEVDRGRGEIGQEEGEALPFAAACSSQTCAQVRAGRESEPSVRPSVRPCLPARAGVRSARSSRSPRRRRRSAVSQRCRARPPGPWAGDIPGDIPGDILLVSTAAALPWHWLRREGTASLRRGSWNAAGPVASPGYISTRGKKMFPQELAQKIRGYQEQIASLNSKCKMLTMKAKHATMLLTVTEVEGLSEGMEELDSDLLPAHPTHPSVVMVSNALVTARIIWAASSCIITTSLCSKLPQLTSTFSFWNGCSVANQTSCSLPLLYFCFMRVLKTCW